MGSSRWTDEKTNMLMIMFDEQEPLEKIAIHCYTTVRSVSHKLRLLGYTVGEIAPRDLADPPDDERTAAYQRRHTSDFIAGDTKFQCALRKAIKDGLERPHVGTIVDTSPLTYERRTYSSVSRDSGCGSAAALCAEWA